MVIQNLTKYSFTCAIILKRCNYFFISELSKVILEGKMKSAVKYDTWHHMGLGVAVSLCYFNQLIRHFI